VKLHIHHVALACANHDMDCAKNRTRGTVCGSKLDAMCGRAGETEGMPTEGDSGWVGCGE
jgi:hypothetical protein